MDKHLILESVGYGASALIALSMMLSSILRLRLLNSAGAALFFVYGLAIGAYPVAILNALIVLVNAHHLHRMLRSREYFHILPLRPDSDYLRYFLHFYRKEIQAIIPGFSYQPADRQVTLFVLRNCVPAGVLIAEEKPGGVLRVVLDFAVPNYRDLKMGRFLFVEQADFFRERGIKEIVISPRRKEFAAYLVKVGFEPAAEPGQSFRIRLAPD